MLAAMVSLLVTLGGAPFTAWVFKVCGLSEDDRSKNAERVGRTIGLLERSLLMLLAVPDGPAGHSMGDRREDCGAVS